MIGSDTDFAEAFAGGPQTAPEPIQAHRLTAAEKMVRCYDAVRCQDGTRPVLDDAALARHTVTNEATIREARRRINLTGETS